MSVRLTLDQRLNLLRDTVKLNGAGLAGAIALHASGKGLSELGLVGAVAFLIGILAVVRSIYSNRLLAGNENVDLLELKVTGDVGFSGMAFVFGSVVLTASVFLVGWGQS